LEPKEVLAVLASCIVDGKKQEKEPSVNELNVTDKVKDALHTLSDLWCQLTAIEKKKGAKYTPWELGTFWIDPIWRWMEGESIATLCSDYGIYEGNLIRSVLKLQSMLEEWRSLAGYSEHLDVLDSLRDADSLLVRESVIQDSLYLHL
jgi:superfamily II RNA helicase